MVNFRNRLAGKKAEKPTDPVKLYDTLDRAHDKGPLRPAQRNRCLAGVLISGEGRAGRSAADYRRSVVSTDAA
jgi:hypothetical protein